MKRQKRIIKIVSITAILMVFAMQTAGTCFAAETAEAATTEQTSEAQKTDAASEETLETENMPAEAATDKTDERQQSAEESTAAAQKTAKKTKVKAETKTLDSLNLGSGDITIAKNSVTQGNTTINHKNSVTITGSGNTVTVKEYSGTIILKSAIVRKSMKLTEGSRVTLVLDGKNEILGDNDTALQVTTGNKVTIEGSGSLKAAAAGSGAGIGGLANGGSSYKKEQHSCGIIHIKQGTITAVGKNRGAGIGGGNHCDGGEITITGTADVTAIGDGGGAGIGSGLGSSALDNGKKGPGYYQGGNITISGKARVKATGSDNSGAGIGGGMYADSGIIKITGGNVEATGYQGYKDNHGAAGIGGGYQGHGYVEISGGTVNGLAAGNADNNCAAGIGSGGTPNSSKDRKNNARGREAFLDQTTVKISGGSVTATGGAGGGAGIGGGSGADKVVVEISGGSIDAKGAAGSRKSKLGGAGIGSGNLNSGKYASAADLSINIRSGSVTATGGWGASGIGSGAENDQVKNLSISDHADILAIADGTKFALDTYNRPQNSWKTVSGSKLLQGTFMKNDQYEGLRVTAYEDMIPDSGMDLFYGEKVRSAQLPDGYRSFAMTVKGNADYVIQGADEWFSMDLDHPQENAAGEKASHTAHYATGSENVSDNYWLHLREVYAERVVPGVDIPEEETTTTTTATTTTTTTTTTRNTLRGGGTTAAATVMPGAAPVAVAPAPVTVIPPAIVPLADNLQDEEPAERTTIEDQQTPLGAGNAHWALLNLILTIVTALLSILLLLLYFTRRKQEEDLEKEQPETEIKRRGMMRLASVIIAVVTIIVFVITEDMALPMQWTDKWTVLMILLTVIQGIAVLLSKKKERKIEDSETYA